MSTGTDSPRGTDTPLSPDRRVLLEQRLRRSAARTAPGAADAPPSSGGAGTDGADGADRGGPGSGAAIPRRPAALDDRPPASHAQERLWFMEQYAPGTAAYAIPLVYRVRGTLEPALLQRAVDAVVARHEPLRTRFPATTDGRPEVRVADRVDVEVRVTDLADAGGGGDADDAARLARATELASAEADLPFDLATGPLLRALLIRLAPEDAVLVLTVHHIAADGWSTDVLIRELVALYDAFRDDRPASLPELPVRYGDYARWQRDRLAGPAAEESLAYWRAQLADLPPLDLPTDRPRPAVVSTSGAAYPVDVDADLADALTGLAARHGATVYMTLLAALDVLLWRYTGQEDFAVGSPIAGRQREELEPLVGMFANVVTLRADLSGDPTFVELLGRVRDTALAAYTHQEVPFEHLVSALNVARDLRRTPLFGVTLAMQNYSRADHALPGLSLEWFPFDVRVTRFDLELYLFAPDRGLHGYVTYNTDLFDRGTVGRLLDGLMSVLRGAVDAPAARVSTLPVLPADQRAAVLAAGRGERVPTPEPGPAAQPDPGHAAQPDRTLVDLLDAPADRTPDATAVVAGEVRLTYAEVTARSRRLARRLVGLGVGPESRVGLCAKRSAELVVGMLAILRAGAAYVPLDPELPPLRLASLLADAGVAAVVTSEALGARLDVGGAPVVVPDVVPAAGTTDGTDLGNDGDDPVGAPPLPVAAPDGAAYVIYTSGSTGRPKGVVTAHRAIVNRLEWMQATYRLAGDDVVLQKTPIGFDVSVWEFLWPLCTGAALVLAAPGGHRDAAYLRDLVVAEQVTTLHFVPSMLAVFLAEEGVEACRSLRRVVCSGEVLPPDLARRARQRLPGELWNLYGPTEAAIDVSAWRCDDLPDAATTVPVGRPIANVDLRVLDTHLEPVPFGAPGELCIGGLAPARGYLGRPGRTAGSFVPDPYGAPGSRLYRTGDLARQRPDGVVEFLGRRDGQVKLRGQRIELGEIEAVLRGLPEVAEAAVTVRTDTPGDARLVAYVVPTADGREGGGGPGDGPEGGDGPGDGPEGAAAGDERPGVLRAALAERLPESMVPAAYVLLDALPLGPTGKLDRAALPAPDTRREIGVEAVAPRTATERAVAVVWTALLPVEDVGVDDDFFTLGGHSLLATQVVARLRSTLPEGSRPVSVMDLFKLRTVRRLAAHADAGAAAPDGPRELLHELTPPVPTASRRLTVVAVPYGGGSAIVYQPVADELPADTSLYALAIPGHDVGLAEEPLPLEEVSRLACEEVLRRIDGPVALYGHCGVGSALTVDLARRLEAAGRRLEAVYIGAAFPFARPQGRLIGRLARFTQQERLLSDRVYANWMRSQGADLTGLDPEHARFVIRNMRRDTRTAEEYFTGLFSSDVPPLRAPVVSVVGDRDPATEFAGERFREWHGIARSTALVVLPAAGHFFLKYRAADVAAVVTTVHPALAPETAEPGAREPDELGGDTWRLTAMSTAGTPATSAVPTGTSTTGTSRTEAPAAEAPTAAATAATGGGGKDRSRRPGGRGRPPAPEPSMRRFVVVAGAQLVSMAGSALTEFALPLWVYLRTGSVAQFAVLAALALLPGLVLAPLAGAIVDRHSRRAVMLAGDVSAGILQGGLALLYATGALRIGHVYVVVAGLSVALTFQRLAYTSAVPQLVPKRFLGHANGMVQMAAGVAQLLVPLVAVALVASIGLGGILAIDMTTFLVAVGIVVFVRFPATLPFTRRESLWAEIVHGFRYATGTPGFRAMLGYFALLNVFLSPLFLLVSPLVLGFASLGDVGRVSVAGGVGAALGGLTMGLWGGPRRRHMRAVLLAALVLAAFALLAGAQPRSAVVAVGFGGMLFWLAIVNGIYATIVQLKVPPRYHGRVFAVQTMVAWSTIPLGFALVAPLATALLEPLMADDGALAPTVGAVIGTGTGRGIALLYVLFGLAMAVLSLVALRHRRLAHFDADVPDALPDDLVGVQELQERRPERVAAGRAEESRA